MKTIYGNIHAYNALRHVVVALFLSMTATATAATITLAQLSQQDNPVVIALGNDCYKLTANLTIGPDMAGRTVAHGRQGVADVSHLPAGVYLATNGYQSIKFALKR